MRKITIIFISIAMILLLASCEKKVENNSQDINHEDEKIGNNEQKEDKNKDNANTEDDNEDISENQKLNIYDENVDMSNEKYNNIKANTVKLEVEGSGYDKLKEAMSNINNEIANNANIRVNQLVEISEDMSENSTIDVIELVNEDSIELIRISDNIVSFFVNIYYNSGGPHPYTMVDGYTVDVKDGKILQLKDLVSDKDKLLEIIIDKVNKYEGSDGFFEGYEDVITDIYNTEDVNRGQIAWTIDNEQIKIIINTYVVAPYAVGPIEINIKFDEVQNLVIDKWR